MAATGVGSLLNGGKPSYSYRTEGSGPPQPTVFPPDALTSAGAPKNIKKVRLCTFSPIDYCILRIQLDELPHGDVVCAVSIARDRSRVFTGGKGAVKVCGFDPGICTENSGLNL